MLQVELLEYKIVRLEMVNLIDEAKDISISNGTESEGQFEDEEDLAMVHLTEYVEMVDGYDMFHIELELEGFFHIEGMETREIRKEAHAMCYDKLRTYAVQIIKHLGVETGFAEFAMPQRFMDTDLIEFGEEPEDRRKNAMKFQMKKYKEEKSNE